MTRGTKQICFPCRREWTGGGISGKLARVADGKADWFSRGCVALYFFVHGKLHLPGAGWFVRRCARAWPGLQHYPFSVPTVGVAILDFRDAAAFGMINACLGELENDASLMRAFSIFIQPGDVVWDIGANVGFIAQLLVQPPFQVGRLDAFEPSPVALKTLQSLFLNHPRVHVHPIGLGAVNETLRMSVNPKGSTLGSILRDLPGGIQVSVPVRRGDDYRNGRQLPAPKVIKIDVEGFEPQVLNGLRETIRDERPIIIFEHIWLSEEQVRQAVPEGYELAFLLDDGTITNDYAVRLRGANAALVPHEKRALLNAFSAPVT